VSTTAVQPQENWTPVAWRDSVPGRWPYIKFIHRKASFCWSYRRLQPDKMPFPMKLPQHPVPQPTVRTVCICVVNIVIREPKSR